MAGQWVNGTVEQKNKLQRGAPLLKKTPLFHVIVFYSVKECDLSCLKKQKHVVTYMKVHICKSMSWCKLFKLSN